MERPLKDVLLAQASAIYNVAQFASFGPDGELRFEVLAGSPPTASRRDLYQVAGDLLARCGSVNIRTFKDSESKSTDFIYGLTELDEIVALAQGYLSAGFFVILNETIDIHDGGVSGVSMAGITEFSPDATPRVVENADGSVARLPSEIASNILAQVYGVRPYSASGLGERLEFSLHPRRVGHRQERVLCWEVTSTQATSLHVQPRWPNSFSRMLGDKVYGLLVADAYGLPVPQTTVIPRRIAPFRFGTSTESGEVWIRTSPSIPQAGRFTTQHGWEDPFTLLEAEDPNREVASILAQEGAISAYSGGAASQSGAPPIVEGAPGRGDLYMAGGRSEPIPDSIEHDVADLLRRAELVVGPAQIEWVHDGRQAWLLQLHARSIQPNTIGVINPGDAEHWISFDPLRGLTQLRDTIADAILSGAGIEITRPVGITSHVGDILRSAGIPARLTSLTGEQDSDG